MKKVPWSISTTVRNPERLKDFLKVLKQLEGSDFKSKNQIQYQVLLIKERLYSPTKIPTSYRALIDDFAKEIPLDIARKIFDFQHYEDPPMRGRQSVNPLNKLGFSIAKDTAGAIKITSLGNLFISPESDIGYIFFKSLLKLQFPNPWSDDFTDKKGFNIRPFIAVLHLINKIKKLSREEFAIFCPTLLHFKDIDRYSKYILKSRTLKSKTEKDKFIKKFLKEFYSTKSLTRIQIDNLFDYGDNAMRYFRLTRYFRVTKQPLGRWIIELEPARTKEIEQLLVLYDGSAINFETVDEYIDYLSDIDKPELPWELDYEKSKDVALSLLDIVKRDFNSLADVLKAKVAEAFESTVNTDLNTLDSRGIGRFVNKLRNLRSEIIEIKRGSVLRKNINQLKDILSVFKDKKKFRELEPVEFEYMISQCLKIINDELEIKPNCILDDEGSPIGFAPGNKADIEGYYESFNSIFEVTLDVSRHQVYRESVPVMRHLKDFESTNTSKPAFCVFVAPRVHNDTVNYFWYSLKYGFEGRKQSIVALDLAHFVEILEFFINTIEQKNNFTHRNLKTLFELITSNAAGKESSTSWFADVSQIIKGWQQSIAP
ncbi:MAG: AlwI family type II restriction endonuclease [Candidatus Omnitrophota bacterium]